MKDKENVSTKDNKLVYALDAMLLEKCTTKEQEQQILRIIQNRKQKEKLCVKSTTATHSYKTI